MECQWARAPSSAASARALDRSSAPFTAARSRETRQRRAKRDAEMIFSRAPAPARDWRDAFQREFVDALAPNCSYAHTAKLLRRCVRAGAVSFFDIEKNPEKFFEAHRMLATRANDCGPGMWIRFTVQYNLCAGTVVALASKSQRARLRAVQEKGKLGCFCLTEKLAGVNSGLVVNTKATYDLERRVFVIDSGGDDGTKNWISQGLTADVAVVIAELVVNGTNYGPHGFFVRLRDAMGRLLRGVTVGDMGAKTTGNDLDNAWVRFDSFAVPHDALLNKYASVDAVTGVYSKRPGIRTMDMIGQRLFTGRVAVAQAALSFARKLYDDTKVYSDAKKCTMRGSAPSLSNVPQLKALYDEAYATLARLDSYVKTCEVELCACLRAKTIPSARLVQAIAVAKIKAVDTAIELAFRLKQEVGSYALMSATGFDNTDFLQCCKFAEGDSRILSQKLARDCFGAFTKNEHGDTGVQSEIELELCQRIASIIEDQRAVNPRIGKIEAWDCAWREVYRLAEIICERVMHEHTSSGAHMARSKL